MSVVNLGGDRLGSGAKNNVRMRTYSRSTFDLSYTWRSSMAAGTLVPFMKQLALPGDSFEIKLNAEAMTLPTVGPLFGSYKLQMDVFTVPMRLYNRKLHMNRIGIGKDMYQALIPQVEIEAYSENAYETKEQIEPSTLLSYMGIKGLGRAQNSGVISRQFNAVPLLAYYDIYKNYYANQQEERGFVVHNTLGDYEYNVTGATWQLDADPTNGHSILNLYSGLDTTNWDGQGSFKLLFAGGDYDGRKVKVEGGILINGGILELDKLYNKVEYSQYSITWSLPNAQEWIKIPGSVDAQWKGKVTSKAGERIIDLQEFPLKDIDALKDRILDGQTTFTKGDELFKYLLAEKITGNGKIEYAKKYTQEGLLIKTYQSDLFNNWLNSEWVDGANGISEATAIDTTGDSFTLDQLNIASKVYKMLNRIAVSGGTYDDWLDATYSHNRTKGMETPRYEGSLIREIGFQEVVSSAAAEDQPLGQLAGRGVMTGKNKGGYVKIKTDEPCYILGIASITPRVDYSQGNEWDTSSLKSYGDFHMPALSGVGFQELVTDTMHWADSQIDGGNNVAYKSAGKIPAWSYYMTNINKTYGNFAIDTKEMFMTLNRKYEVGENGIEDLTTYVDPSKFNNIFADERLDAQNFWLQISNKITARRKMSSKQIPNL